LGNRSTRPLVEAARNAWLLGHIDKALERSRYAQRTAQAVNRPYDIAFAKYMAAILAILLRQPGQARLQASEALELSDRHSFPQFSAISRVVLGRAIVELGEKPEGEALIADGIARMTGTGARVALTLYHAWAAEAAMLAGKWDQAMRSIEEALTVNPEERFFLPECLRLRGEIQAALGQSDDAVRSLAESSRVAQAMGARLCLVRTWLAARRLGLEAAGPLTLAAARALDGELVEGRGMPDLVEFSASLGWKQPLRSAL
jgi:tetratricopeptide (TPR) repeat protein